MPRYFFDVQNGDVTEADLEGTELASADLIHDFALDLCLEVARERLPAGSAVSVRVRSADGPTVYVSSIHLSGAWV